MAELPTSIAIDFHFLNYQPPWSPKELEPMIGHYAVWFQFSTLLWPAKHRIIIPSNQYTLFQIIDKQIYDGEKEAESESQEKNNEVIEMDDIEGDGKNGINKITAQKHWRIEDA